MRLMPIITAVLVSTFLYFLVIERDRLLAFAQVSSDEPTASEAVEETKKDLIKVVVIESSEREIETAIILRGRTEAARQVDVRAETVGSVTSSPLRKGSEVAEGDILCQIDLGTREASITQAQAALDEANLNLNASTRLYNDGHASEAQFLNAQARVTSAQAALASAETELERVTMRAPFAGLLETDTAELGSFLSAGSICATVIQLDPIKLVGFVPETEVNKVAVGAPAGARLASGGEVQGTVTFLSRSADNTTRTFRVEIEVPNPDFAIRDGQTADILIGTDGRMAHLIPQSALTLNNDGELGVRSVSDENIVTFNAVTIVRDSRDGVWVTGLPETARVIVIGQEYVIEGIEVATTLKEAAE